MSSTDAVEQKQPLFATPADSKSKSVEQNQVEDITLTCKWNKSEYTVIVDEKTSLASVKR